MLPAWPNSESLLRVQYPRLMRTKKNRRRQGLGKINTKMLSRLFHSNGNAKGKPKLANRHVGFHSSHLQ